MGVRTPCLGPSSLCIFKRANRQSSPFFSWATLVNVGRTTAWWKWEAEAQFLHFPSVKYSKTILLQIPAELYERQRNLGPQKDWWRWVCLEVHKAWEGFGWFCSQPRVAREILLGFDKCFPKLAQQVAVDFCAADTGRKQARLHGRAKSGLEDENIMISSKQHTCHQRCFQNLYLARRLSEAETTSWFSHAIFGL